MLVQLEYSYQFKSFFIHGENRFFNVYDGVSVCKAELIEEIKLLNLALQFALVISF
jgi:hypothetical protein